jgi:hypothetical protein
MRTEIASRSCVLYCTAKVTLEHTNASDCIGNLYTELSNGEELLNGESKNRCKEGASS